MQGIEGAVLIPLLILGSAAILYLGLISVRRRQERGSQSGDLSPIFEPPSHE